MRSFGFEATRTRSRCRVRTDEGKHSTLPLDEYVTASCQTLTELRASNHRLRSRDDLRCPRARFLSRCEHRRDASPRLHITSRGMRPRDVSVSSVSSRKRLGLGLEPSQHPHSSGACVTVVHGRSIGGSTRRIQLCSMDFPSRTYCILYMTEYPTCGCGWEHGAPIVCTADRVPAQGINQKRDDIPGNRTRIDSG